MGLFLKERSNVLSSSDTQGCQGHPGRAAWWESDNQLHTPTHFLTQELLVKVPSTEMHYDHVSCSTNHLFLIMARAPKIAKMI